MLYYKENNDLIFNFSTKRLEISKYIYDVCVLGNYGVYNFQHVLTL